MVTNQSLDASQCWHDNNYNREKPTHIENYEKPCLLLEELAFHRDWQVVLHDVNLTIYPKQWIILRGANGCGKTTLLKLCVGLLTPTAGKIAYNGTYRYLGHQNGIKPAQTLTGFVGSLSTQKQQQTARDLIEALALQTYVDIPFYQLSTGLKRRVALVQLFTPAVDLYIIDEPLDNLDPASCYLAWQLLAQKIEEGAALLMTHHGVSPAPHPAIQEIFLDA